jgi:diguanylate cyclase (GGDEF)-like protein
MNARVVLARMRSFFAARPDPYADADRHNARRFTGLVWLIQAAAASVFVAFSSPAARFGSDGWAVAAGSIAGAAVLGTMLLRDGERFSDDALLGLSYLGVTQVALLQWLAGDMASPYLSLFLLWVVVVPACHPPRRVAAFLAFLAFAAASPLIYGAWNGTTAADIAGRVLIWFALAAVIMARVDGFRRQRIGLSRRGDVAERKALFDALTGLRNRRAFDQDLSTEVARARRSGVTLTLVLADLDGFKEINDRWGHVHGDRCLRRVAGALSATLRGSDRGYRWGGDEFAALLPDTDTAGAERVCDRISSYVVGLQDGRDRVAPEGERLAISFGIVELGDGMGAIDMLEAADLALLTRKADAGRRPSPLD